MNLYYISKCKRIFILICLINCISMFLNKNVNATEENAEYKIMKKRDILTLKIAYPDNIVGVENNNNSTYIITNSGAHILYDDKKEKSVDGKLNNPDLQDMLEQQYPLDNIDTVMPDNLDPGRARVYALLNDVYGISQSKIESNLVNVRTGNMNARFNKQNQAAESLKKCMIEINQLIKNNSKIYNFVYPVSGTFNYRYVSGTGRLSAHAFGIAIDLKSDKSDYWKWATRESATKRISIYPKEIVQVFEKNNFIWGGKWSHFDILHFEYRPEVIIKARYTKNNISQNDKWYIGFPETEESINEFIKIIDEKI